MKVLCKSVMASVELAHGGKNESKTEIVVFGPPASSRQIHFISYHLGPLSVNSHANNL